MIDKMNQHKSTKYKLTVTQLGKGKIYHTSLMIFCGANFGANKKPPTELFSVSG